MIKLEDKPNVVAPGGAYPYGNIKDNPGDGTGTPVNTEVYADFHQFFARMFGESGITSNNLPDNNTNGFQYFEALRYFTKMFTDIIGYAVNTALGSDSFQKMIMSVGGGDVILTLPPSAHPANFSKNIAIKAKASGLTTLIPDGADTINGAVSLEMKTGDVVHLLLNGSVYEIVSYYSAAGWNTYSIPDAKVVAFGGAYSSQSGSFRYKINHHEKKIEWYLTLPIVITSTTVVITIDFSDIFTHGGGTVSFIAPGVEITTLGNPVKVTMNPNDAEMLISDITGNLPTGSFTFGASGVFDIQ